MPERNYHRRMARYAREQRASLMAMALYPLFLAAVLFFDALPYLRAMMEATA